MRILILTPRLPWPPKDGGAVAMARLAESLAACGAEVEVLSMNPPKHRGVAAGPVAVRAVDVDTSRVVAPALRAMTSRMPYIVARFVSRAFREEVRAAVRRFRPDVVQIESPFLLPYVAEAGGAKIVLRSLNVEFRIWEGLARVERNPLRRVALRRVASSLRAYELREMRRVDAVVPITVADAEDLRSLGVAAPMHVVPCGVVLEERVRAEIEPDTVAFIGSLNFRPNLDAVRWIVDELWPRVVRKHPAARLEIAGSSPPPWLRAKVHANVADPAAFLRTKAVVIAPLFAGGGMRIKVLEAMALGKAVVATALGAGGIDVEPGRDIAIAEDADSFAAAVVRLLRDPAEAARLGDAARAKVAARYDSDALARGLLQFYASL